MEILELIKKRVVFLDGAMGTNIVRSAKCVVPSACNEQLNILDPDVIYNVNRSFVDAGSDIIETNTFNANRISLAEFGIPEQVKEINLAAVAIAKKAAASSKKRIYIAGDCGPMNKLPSFGQISFDEMHSAYLEQVLFLIEGGVDLILFDTSQDILQMKTAVIAANDAFLRAGKRLPIMASVTIDATGKMLLGTELDAVVATLVPLGVDILGLNCGLGPNGMEEAVRVLCKNSPVPVALQPNAGLPEIVNGKTHYGLSPEEFAKWSKYYVEELGVNLVGGCCGTRPDHIAAVCKAVGEKKAKARKIDNTARLASLFTSTDIKQKPSPLIIGERMNINGSKKFREFLMKDDYEGAANMAMEQEAGGAHAIDVSVQYAGRDELKDMHEVITRVVQKTRLPICIDSTNPVAIETALKLIPGRPIINSINLEDGGVKARKILALAKKFGAAVVALTIDPDGMARDADKKVRITSELVKLCAEFGINEEDILLDPLTFTLGEPKAAEFGSGAETLKAIEKIKKKHKDINICLGVSNVSYGLGKKERKVLNSVFLHEAVKAGLTAAIIHAAQITPLASLQKETVDIALDLIWKRKPNALDKFIHYFSDFDLEEDTIVIDETPEDGLKKAILRGNRTNIQKYLEILIKDNKAENILNEILLPAMAEVGKKFDAGELPLPFVLGSAEAMRAATDFLAKYFEKNAATKKGKIVLATVRGDVHDIGKDLVDIVMSNNGFEVLNIGVKQPVDNIMKAAVEANADMIGLSGLLVESALIMKDDLHEMTNRGITIPVICGGAALTKKYVEGELASAYKGAVYYAKDAFDGLRIADEITKKDKR